MKALISQREITDQHGILIDSLESNYVHYFESIGYKLLPVSNFLQRVDYLFDFGIELLILTGGGSVPSRYYTNSQIENNDCFYRDKIEKELFENAIRRNIPVLAICRGMQYVNCLLGGSISVLSGLSKPRPIGVDHPIYLNNEIIHVNNYHNDGIFTTQIANGLDVIGVDIENNIVECYESLNPKILATQFHPERINQNEASQKTIDILINQFLGII